MKQKLTVPKVLGYALEVALYIGVLAFEMIESLNFFTFAFRGDQWYLAYLGFFMTSIATLIYFYMFKFIADTTVKKATAISMMVVCAIGSVITAGYGFNVAANEKTGFTFTQSEIDAMILAVQLLIGLHILALIVYNAADGIMEAFSDTDGDGVPNIIDKTPNGTAPVSPQPADATRQYQASIAALELRIKELENPTKAAGEPK